MMTRAHVFFSGRVQGVFFRAFTREKAREIGVKGWVRNLPDGRVEALFEGDKTAIHRLLGTLKTGPSYSRTEDVSVKYETYKNEFSDFQVKHF
jgi:acylphosphatase